MGRMVATGPIDHGIGLRVSDLPATCDAADGNPDIRVPETIDKKDGQRAQRALKEDAVAAGNPDIRVPKNVKSENGLRMGHTEKEEDAEGITAKSAEREASGEDQKTTDPYLGEEETQNTRDYPTKGQEGPKKLELCHVPGGTWLNQEQSCLRGKLRFMVGREEGGGEE
ncbi:hypothetical protein NDU88_008524 [Pleurodeles waltl]|uniref:Uncharacterized protein n=1 Tax=Pleurodeles waltl TaxID=8319 RepID=A0AAV7RU18_PLEWA|nr:hypothetical protein NDU88_008524 [Pleurodeles waltl]